MRALIIFLLIFAAVSPCRAAEEKIVRLATLTDFIPFCFRKENAAAVHGEIIPPGSDSVQLQGYAWDVVRESFHAMGYGIRLEVVPWERVIHYLNTGKVDAVFPAIDTATRLKTYVFSKKSVDEMRMVLYLRRDSPLVWRGLRSLEGQRVAEVRGWSYGDRWEASRDIVKEETDTVLQGFNLLDKRRLTAVIGYEAVYDYALKEKGLRHLYRKEGPIEVVSEYMMGRRNDPASAETVRIFDQGREKIEREGVLGRIARKWL
jgi:polar amino acid transport system substrate-binding protein